MNGPTLDECLRLTPDLVCLLDSAGNCRQLSLSWETTLRWPVSDLLDLPLSDVLHPDDRPAFAEALANASERGAPARLVSRCKTPEERWRRIEWNLSPATPDGAILGIGRDVTEQVNKEEQLLRSQRMESIGLLAGGIAHDLNNVLSPIMMSVELLSDDLDAEERGEIIDTLRQHCERGAGIIHQVLTFARGVEGECSLLQVRHLVKDMVKIARETFPKNITVKADLPTELWTVNGDPTQLHQVLLNLCVNARDAMPAGGCISITASNDTLTETRRHLDAEIPPGRYLHLTVSDTGCGMTPNTLSRVFEPFYTTKDPGKGTGLGLPTVLGIIKSHNGLIEAESSLGSGTSFHLYLPAAEGEVQEKNTAADAPRRGQGETILVVDDEPAILNVAAKILEHHGYKTLTAGNGAAAVAAYARHLDTVKLVVTDVMMPIMDGVALVNALQSIDPKVRIVVASGYLGCANSHDHTDELTALGVTALLKKPFTAVELLRMVAQTLHDGEPDGSTGSKGG